MDYRKHLLAPYLDSLTRSNEYSQEQQEQEIELTYYTVLTDLEDQLSKAPQREYHEQFERMFFDESGELLCFIRSRQIDHGENYELTIKQKIPGIDGRRETSVSSNHDMHELMREIADRRFRKVRHFFPTEQRHTTEGESNPLIWEVDAYLLEDGGFDPMVKIDLELPSIQTVAPSLPFKIDDVIDESTDLTEEQKEQIDAFWKRTQLKD